MQEGLFFIDDFWNMAYNNYYVKDTRWLYMSNIPEIIKRCLSYDDEQEWFDFKDSWYELDGIGQYISALSNAAAMAGESFGYLIWGINDKTHELTDTKFRYQRDIKKNL